MNCALAHREILGHYARGVFQRLFPAGESGERIMG